jgi:hypothetical protein
VANKLLLSAEEQQQTLPPFDEVSHEGEPQRGLHLLNMQNVLAAMKDDSRIWVK